MQVRCGAISSYHPDDAGRFLTGDDLIELALAFVKLAAAIVQLPLSIVILTLAVAALLTAPLIAPVIIPAIVIISVVVIGAVATRVIGVVNGLLNIADRVIDNIGASGRWSATGCKRAVRLRNVSSGPISSESCRYLNQAYTPE